MVSSLRRLYSNYGLFFGGGNISVEMKKKFEKKEASLFIQDIRKLDQTINGNFEGLNEIYFKEYTRLIKTMPQF